MTKILMFANEHKKLNFAAAIGKCVGMMFWMQAKRKAEKEGV